MAFAVTTRPPVDTVAFPTGIGPPGCSIEEARFVPISAEKLSKAMSHWEKYIHADAPDRLIQLAALHVEFEALHPFLDGNGRLGRMLIPLFLFERELLATPTFYLSAYFEARRDEYYQRLLAVSRDGDWTGWCEFFLRALTAQAGANTQKARDILHLYEEKKAWIVDRTHSQHAIRALDFIFDRPIFQSSDFVADSGMPEWTAKRIAKILRESGLLRTVRDASGRRPAILMFPELLNIAEGTDAF